MNRKKRIQLKKKFAIRNTQRDMFGTPYNRAKTWRTALQHDAKKTRRKWKSKRVEF